MTRQNMIDKFVEYRQLISAWFDDNRKDVNEKAVTFLHYEQGYLDGYAQRQKEEQEEMMDAL